MYLEQVLYYYLEFLLQLGSDHVLYTLHMYQLRLVPALSLCLSRAAEENLVSCENEDQICPEKKRKYRKATARKKKTNFLLYGYKN